MTPGDIKTVVDIVNGGVAALAIVAAGWWFLFSRSLTGTLHITLTLNDVTTFHDTPVAFVRVRVKNVGRTRINTRYCACVAEVLTMQDTSDSYPSIITAGKLNFAEGRRIFLTLRRLDPQEEACEDIAVKLPSAALFALGVQFTRKGTEQTWKAIGVFSADNQAKCPLASGINVGNLESSMDKPGQVPTQ